MKILFICKHNRFRSKVAEAIFNSLNKNEKIIAGSAGFHLDEARPYVADIVVKIMKEKGYKIGGVPRRISAKEINDYDMIVIVANNVEPEFFISSGFKGKIIWWKIKDCDEKDVNGISKRIGDIEKRVERLISLTSKLSL